jgi:hypothetical protein
MIWLLGLNSIGLFGFPGLSFIEFTVIIILYSIFFMIFIISSINMWYFIVIMIKLVN